MKMKALKPLGEEKPAAINDTKFSDTLVDVPLPDSEPKTESKTKTKTKTKTDQPNADPVQDQPAAALRHVQRHDHGGNVRESVSFQPAAKFRHVTCHKYG